MTKWFSGPRILMVCGVALLAGSALAMRVQYVDRQLMRTAGTHESSGNIEPGVTEFVKAVPSSAIAPALTQSGTASRAAKLQAMSFDGAIVGKETTGAHRPPKLKDVQIEGGERAAPTARDTEVKQSASIIAMTEDTAVITGSDQNGGAWTQLVSAGDTVPGLGRVKEIRLGAGQIATEGGVISVLR